MSCNVGYAWQFILWAIPRLSKNAPQPSKFLKLVDRIAVCSPLCISECQELVYG